MPTQTHPEWLCQQLQAQLLSPDPIGPYLDLFLEPQAASWEWLYTPTEVAPGHQVRVLTLHHWVNLARIASFMVYGLPVGDPYRQNLPAFHAALMAHWATPGLWCDYGKVASEWRMGFLSEYHPKLRRKPVLSSQGHPQDVYRTRGVLALDDGEEITLYAELRTLLARTSFWHRVLKPFIALSLTAQLVLIWRSRDCHALMQELAQAQYPVGSYVSNPLVVDMGLSLRLASALGVSPESAALYLVRLTHLCPTDEALQTLFGWDEDTLYMHQCALLEVCPFTYEPEAKPREWRISTRWLSGPYQCEPWKRQFYLSHPSAGFLALSPMAGVFRSAYMDYLTGCLPERMKDCLEVSGGDLYTFF